jgi:2-oxoglutarate dehydrogenase E1 component
MKREFKKPLILMSPKSLLRHKDCVSKVENFTDNEFWSILDDESVNRKTAKRVVFCSGKLYYELAAHREENGIKDTALIRIEQLYPLNTELLKRIGDNYPKAETFAWCQEEPKNMGAWTFISTRLAETLGKLPAYVGRKESASPAVGSLAVHKHEQAKIIKAAFEV